MARDQDLISEVESVLIGRFGLIDFSSDFFRFKFTDYYTDEMGAGLWKKFVSFGELESPESIWEDKIYTNGIEIDFSDKNSRLVNLDPGFIDRGKLVLLTTKSAPHRIYLAEGIYSEITLMFVESEYKPFRWTYEDFQTKLARKFFMKVRSRYLDQIKTGTGS